MRKIRRLVDEFVYPGFYPLTTIRNHPTKVDGRIITLQRRQKKVYAEHVGQSTIHGTIERNDLSEICPVVMLRCILKLKYDVFHARYVAK